MKYTELRIGELPENPVLTTHALVALSYLTDYKNRTDSNTNTRGFWRIYRLLPTISLSRIHKTLIKNFYDRYVVYKEMSYGTSPYPIKKNHRLQKTLMN